MRYDGATFAGHPRNGSGSSGSSLRSGGKGWSGSTIQVSDEQWESVALGPHELTMNVTILVADESREARDEADALAVRRITFRKTIEVIDASQHTIELIDDPSQQQAVEDAVTVERIEVEEAYDYDKKKGHRWRLEGSLKIEPRPYDLACDVFVRAGNREWPMSRISKVASGSTHYSVGGDGPLTGFNADRVDVILRPSREIGYGTPTITKLWNRPIVIENVEVDWKVPRDGQESQDQTQKESP